MLENQPARLHLVIAGRADPPIPLSRLRAQQKLTELRTDDLRFTAEETASFPQSHHGSGPGRSGHNRAERPAQRVGSPAFNSQRCLCAGGDDGHNFVESFTGSHHFVLDYLAEEVLQQQPAEVVNFLYHTAVLDRLSGPLCDALTGRSGSQSLLENLLAENLFLVPLDNERRWFRYHNLFADLLRARLLQTQPDEVLALHRRAAAWFKNSMDKFEEAVQHALAGEDLKMVAGPDRSQWPRYCCCAAKSCDWAAGLNNLPENLVLEHPWLAVYHAWVLMLCGQVEPVEDQLQTARTSPHWHN